jgi:hypothetical protein
MLPFYAHQGKDAKECKRVNMHCKLYYTIFTRSVLCYFAYLINSDIHLLLIQILWDVNHLLLKRPNYIWFIYFLNLISYVQKETTTCSILEAKMLGT